MSDPIMYLFADLHVSEEATHRQHNDRLREVLGTIAAMCAPGDAVQFYGDSVDSPTKGNYALLTQVISPLIDAKVSLSFILGNHDNSKTGLFWWSGGDAMFQAFRKHVNALPRKFEIGNCQMLNVDTTLHTWMPTDLAQGRVGSRQLRWLRSELDIARSRGMFSIVGGHHTPTNIVEPERLLDAAELFNVLRRGHATKYIGGHAHLFDLVTQRFQNNPGGPVHTQGGETEIITLENPSTKSLRDGMCFGPARINLATGKFELL